jgi:hypothetical protein
LAIFVDSNKGKSNKNNFSFINGALIHVSSKMALAVQDERSNKRFDGKTVLFWQRLADATSQKWEIIYI